MRQVGNEVCMGDIGNEYRIVVRKLVGKRYESLKNPWKDT
jgi:hypothetical protein